jgi:hypothetical protein
LTNRSPRLVAVLSRRLNAAGTAQTRQRYCQRTNIVLKGPVLKMLMLPELTLLSILASPKSVVCFSKLLLRIKLYANGKKRASDPLGFGLPGFTQASAVTIQVVLNCHGKTFRVNHSQHHSIVSHIMHAFVRWICTILEIYARLIIRRDPHGLYLRAPPPRRLMAISSATGSTVSHNDTRQVGDSLILSRSRATRLGRRG